MNSANDAAASRLPAPSAGCPEAGHWSHFLAGRLDAERLEASFEHLERCRCCSSLLARIAEEDRLEGDPLALDQDPLYQEAAFLRLRESLSQAASDWEKGPLGEHRQTLGRFRLLRRLGAGGFGHVYLAEDAALQRLVAIKVPRGGRDLPAETRLRFIWEGQVAASLRHANLLSILEAGEDDGIPVIASEYCGGPRLSEVIAQGPIPPRPAAEIVRCLALALEHAHARGIVHRDIKPGNILLSESEDGVQIRGQAFIPKVADFGLAKRIGKPGVEGGEATRTGVLRGTLAYMAPEYLLGDSSTRSDVFALGVVLYEMLTGRRLFANMSLAERLRRAGESVEPLAPAAGGETAPPDLQTICLKCLRHEPDARYRGAGELAMDLERFLLGETILARPVGTLEKGLRWIKRNPSWAALALVAFTLPMLLLAGLLAHNRRLDASLRRAETSERKARELLYAADVRQMFQAWDGADATLYQSYRAKYLAGDGVRGDPRGVEWAFLQKLAESKSGEAAWFAHAGGVACLRFSPDGRTLASAGIDGRIRLWNTGSRQLVNDLSGHVGDVNKIVFSEDGARLASVGDDATLRLWNVRTGWPLQTIPVGNGRLFELGLKQGRNLLVTAGDGPAIDYWDGTSGRAVRRFTAGPRVRALAVHPLAPFLGLATTEGPTPELQILDISADPPTARLKTVNPGGIGDLVFSHDGGRLAAAGLIGFVRVYDVVSGRMLHQLEGHRDAVRTVKFSLHDEFLASGSDDTTVRIWDEAGRSVKALRGHQGAVWTLDFSPDGGRLAAGDSSGVVRLWNWQDRHDLGYDFRADNLGRAAPSILRSLPGGRLVASCRSAAFQILNSETAVVEQWGGPEYATQAVSLACSADGRRVALGTRSGNVLVWDVARREAVAREIPAHQGNAHCCEFIDDQLLITGGEDGACRLWDAETGRLVATGVGHRKPVLAADVSPDGRSLVTASFDGSAIVWSLPSLRPLRTLRGHTGVVSDAMFSPSGELVATCSHDRTVMVYDAASGQRQARYQGHRARVLCLEFSPDGKTVISGDAMGVLRFWQVGTEEALGAIDTGPDALLDVLLNSEASALMIATGVAGGAAGTMVRWNLPRITAKDP